MSNTSGQLFSLPVIFVLEVGGGLDAFVKVFVKGHALIESGKWEDNCFDSRFDKGCPTKV